VPIVLHLQPPAGTAVDNAIVEFGYADYEGNGTTRHDACVAASAKIGAPPFQFASENPSGMPCASECIIAVPAISQRILYYQAKYRDRSGHTVTEGPRQVVAVP
jgi:hypothetical protein